MFARNVFYNIKNSHSSFISFRNTRFCNLYMTNLLRKFRKLFLVLYLCKKEYFSMEEYVW